MTGNEIREMFLRYFEGQGHRRVRSGSLVPIGDPTLLFTNAGMNQFKDVFLGLETRDYKRATSCQKCVRAGGKHNDLENVGFTRRHHTFFEMLGNFSFGDYFKKEAIAYAWELITSPKWFNIPKEKLYVTIFGGAELIPLVDLKEDGEARDFWLGQNVPGDRIFAIPGLEENFWAMGDTGPCGPCSEILYDMGPAASDLGHTDCKFPCDCGRYVEIWNLVFMQFNREADGKVAPLPKPCVDTGMGLERVAAVLLNLEDPKKTSNYDTDLFQSLIYVTRARTNQRDSTSPLTMASLRIVADHARAVTFLISDGVFPSNEGRGYVLRKIMRRAVRHARLLGGDFYVLSNTAANVADVMRNAYPELSENLGRIREVIYAEEERFSRTIDLGLKKLEADIDLLTKDSRKQREGLEKIRGIFDEQLAAAKTGDASELVSPSVVSKLVNEFKVPLEWVQDAAEDRAIRLVSNPERFSPVALPPYSGENAFKIYDTFGLPLDFIKDVLRDQGLSLDEASFDSAMEEQRKRARASWKGIAKEAPNPAYAKLAETFKTEPDFYQGTNTRDCRIEAIISKSGPVNELKPGESAEIVLDRTVFYPESGGQVSDVGGFYDNSESLVLATVTAAYYPVAGLIAHKVTAKETLRVGDRVAVVADATRRELVKRNHTGTHLVHAALRNILGTHVKQAGSLNSPEGLRFDFSHFASVDPEELRDIEQQVNEQIRLNAEIETGVSSLDEALASGALAFFGDKYPEHNVRVVTIPDPNAPRGFYSKELCGGTHVRRSGDIGVLKIVSEQSVAAGVRRIEAVTGTGALESYQRAASLLAHLARTLNVGEDALLAAVEKQSQTVKQLEKQLQVQKQKSALSLLDDLASRVQLVKGVKVLAAQVEGVDRAGMRQLVDSLRQKLGSGVVALGTTEDGKVALITGVTKDLTGKIHAGKLVQALAKLVGGTGGGRAELAEAGGKDTSALKSTLQTLPSLIDHLL
ncbi:MAG TPA: alanine--tRNA ligase [Candidatus Acidoferrales bacterium]|nr:alanine--tRNA ligase [Candidatus Acidoferrales bacterium]